MDSYTNGRANIEGVLVGNKVDLEDEKVVTYE